MADVNAATWRKDHPFPLGQAIRCVRVPDAAVSLQCESLYVVRLRGFDDQGFWVCVSEWTSGVAVRAQCHASLFVCHVAHVSEFAPAVAGAETAALSSPEQATEPESAQGCGEVWSTSPRRLVLEHTSIWDRCFQHASQHFENLFAGKRQLKTGLTWGGMQ